MATKVWGQKSKIDEELDYFTELALHESERWIQAVTRKKFKYPDDPRKSLDDGTLMCELLNGLKPGTIRKVNRLPTPLAGMDNVNVFLEACSKTFGLKDAQLFHPCDLEDLSNRAIADFEDQLKYETDRRLRNVVVTIYWLGRSVQPWYKGPHLDCSAFLDLIGYHHPKVRLTKNIVDSTSENIISEELHCRQESCDSLDRSSGYSSYRGDSKTSSSSYSQHHSRQESSDSVDRNSVYRNDTTKSSLSSDVFEDDPVTSHLRDESYESFVSEDLPLTRRLNSDKRPSDNITPDTGETDNMPIPQEYRRRASHSNRFAEQRYSATFDSTYMPPPDGARSPNLLSNRWKHDAVYQSTPQLNRDSHNDHNRFRFGDNKLENQGIASSSSDNIDGAKPGERRNSTVRKTSTAHADPLQFVYVGGSQLSQKAKEVIEAMEEQKKITKALEHEELDWHSNLSSWKSKMRTKNKAVHERTEEMEKTLDDPEPRDRRKSKTFGEMMAERERRKSTGRNFYPYTEEDVGALGGVNKLNSASTTQDSVAPVYRNSTENNAVRLNGDRTRRAEIFESEHALTASKTNNETLTGRVTEPTTKTPTESHNRYTVSQNARTQDFGSKRQTVTTNEGKRDKGWEMMQRRKEESESQEYEEKTIKISQKPNGEKGFGFTISGGKECCSPVVIEKVALGSAADAYELLEGDEIVAINGVVMTDYYQGSVMYVINQAVRTGVMELRIRRYPDTESDESGEESDEGEQEQQLEKLRLEELEQQQQKLLQQQEEEKRRELEEQQRRAKQREEQQRLEQQRHLKRQQLEKQREEVRQQKLQQLEQQRQQQKQLQKQQEPVPRRRRQPEQQQEKQPEEQRLEKHQQEEQQRIEQQQELEQQQREHQWLEQQRQEQQQQQLQQEQLWQEQQLQELEQQQMEHQELGQQQHEQQQWEQLQCEQQQQWEQQQLENEHHEQQPEQQLRQEEQQLVEDDRQQEMDYHQMELPEVPSEPPPPLPSMPPPAPNWNTFPTAMGEAAAADDDFFDQNDLLPDMEKTSPGEANPGGEREDPVTPKTGCVRTDILRRKSQFLGLKNSEEYNSLQTDKEQKEKYEWERIETSDSIIKDLRSVADTRPQENMWQPLEVTTHDRDSSSYSSYNSRMSPSGNIFDHRSAYDLEQREVEIVANLERDEEAGHNITNNHDCCHDDEKDIYQDQCSSRSTDSVYSSTVASIEARVTLDMQSTLSSSRPPRRSPTERKMLDLEEERRRMERWDAEQEEKRQQLYEAEQQRIRKKHDEELRKSQQLEEERRRELAEKEKVHQRRLDEIRKQAEEDKKRQQEEEDKIRQQEEKRRIRQQQQEDEKRKVRQMERGSNIRQNEQNVFPWQTSQSPRESVDTDRVRIEQEKILAERETQRKREEEERARKQEEEQQRREEEERVRKLQEEQQQREEERVRKMEEERQVQEEREAHSLREKEEQLRQMEERIRREAEQLRLEKERFEMERTNQQNPWSIPQTNIAPVAGGYEAPPTLKPVHMRGPMPPYEDTKVDEVKLGYVPRNNVYQGQYEQVYEPDHLENSSVTSQSQFHIEFKTEPNRIFTLHQQSDNGYHANKGNGLSPRTSFEKLPLRELPIQPKPSLLEEMGLRPESRRMYGSQTNVGAHMQDHRSPTGSDMSLSDTGRESALRSSRLPSGSGTFVPAWDGKASSARHSEYQRRPDPMDDISPRSVPSWTDLPSIPVTSITTSPSSEQLSPTHLTKAELHQIAAVPKPRYNDNWIKPPEENQRRPAPRRSEIMRQNISHAGEHWLFEEAERRRLASQQGIQHLQKRQDPSQYQYGQQWWLQEPPSSSGGSNGYSVEYSGDSGYGLPQRYDFDEQSQSLSSPAYRTSYEGDRYNHCGNQPSEFYPTPHDQTLTNSIALPQYTDTSSHNHSYSAPKPNSPSYHYPPSSTQQYNYPQCDKNAPMSLSPKSPYSDHQQPSRVSYPIAEPVHSRTSSQNSEPPPVPPKPPRLMQGGENSHPAEQVIAVSGYQACAHCGDELGEEHVQKHS